MSIQPWSFNEVIKERMTKLFHSIEILGDRKSHNSSCCRQTYCMWSDESKVKKNNYLNDFKVGEGLVKKNLYTVILASCVPKARPGVPPHQFSVVLL